MLTCSFRVRAQNKAKRKCIEVTRMNPEHSGCLGNGNVKTSVGIYGSIKGEDCIAALCGRKISLYTGRPSGQRTEDCPPSRCSGLSHVRTPPHLRTPPLASHVRTPPHLRTPPYSDNKRHQHSAVSARRRSGNHACGPFNNTEADSESRTACVSPNHSVSASKADTQHSAAE